MCSYFKITILSCVELKRETWTWLSSTDLRRRKESVWEQAEQEGGVQSIYMVRMTIIIMVYDVNDDNSDDDDQEGNGAGWGRTVHLWIYRDDDCYYQGGYDDDNDDDEHAEQEG